MRRYDAHVTSLKYVSHRQGGFNTRSAARIYRICTTILDDDNCSEKFVSKPENLKENMVNLSVSI